MSDYRPHELKKNEKPHMSPPGFSTGEGTERRSSRTPLLIFVLFIALLAGVAAVVFLLPGGPKKIDNTTSLSTPVQQPAPLPSGQETAAQKSGNNEADQLLETLLALQVRGRVENIAAWGGEIYQKVLDTMTIGDGYMAERNYSEAASAYRMSITELSDLFDSRDTIFQTAMEEAHLVMAAGNSEKASNNFAKGLAIDPSSSEAKKGAGRAASLDKVLGIFGEAVTLQKSGDLGGAEAKYVQLLSLDKEFLQGREGLTRVRREIDEQTFEGEMSSFYQAVDADQLAHARSSLKLLETIRSGDKQVVIASRILAEKELSSQVAAMREEAEKLSDAEKWQDALAMYKKILAIAPESLSGVNGQTMASKRLKLDTALADTIARPSRLQDDAQRAAAVKLLSYAQQTEPKGVLLVSQLNRLEELITFATTPVAIRLESDNSTDVAIYHVGRMGQFFSKQIVLKPGKYTIVGTRSGYRDIRKTVEIAPDSGIKSVLIQCEEPI